MNFDDIKNLAIPATALAAGFYLLGNALIATHELHYSNDSKTRWIPNYPKYVEAAATGVVGIVGAGAIIYSMNNRT